ncbi:germination protein YpeB [Alkalihalobacillus sp. BA299]|uniref:germination protein YpeB n=1 Tax=Alkalihalobacillus sp. BA299 TaxID=2815938 RepID=UPI001ADCEED0|nr:germination protein YpeB [Alkalihalobacillus sp. BA299]
MIRSIIIGILAVGLIGTAYWGFQENKQNQVLVQSAENNYQRAFHDLVFHIDQLEDNLGTVLAMNTQRQLSPKLADVWRVTSLAHEELGQLPLGFVDFTDTEEFLYKLGTFSYKTSVRDLEKSPITDKEYETLKELYECSRDIQQQLRKTQATVLQQGLHWLDLEKEEMAEDEPLDNAVVDGFHLVNEKVKGYDEVEWGAGFSQLGVQNDEDLADKLDGKDITEEEAKQKALQFLGLDENAPVHIDETGKGLAYSAYSITIDDPEHEANFFLDITKKGGHPVWALQSREIKEENLSLNEAAEKAKEFLKKNDIDGMQLVDSKQYSNIGVFQFSYLIDNIRVYADSVIIEVALDDGDIIAYEGEDYLLNHKKRKVEDPKLTMEEAKKSLNPRIQVMEDHVAIIKNELGEEVLCYEFYGVLEDNTFRIFINADDGEEELVEKMKHAEPVYDFA